MLRRTSFIRLTAFGSAVALMAVACKSSTKAPPAEDLAGSYGLAAFSQGGQLATIDANDSATFTVTRTVYSVKGTGNLAILTDSGTYTASDTSNVSGVISGPFHEESVLQSRGVAGWYTLSASTDTLTEYDSTQGVAIQTTWVKTAQ